MAAAPLGLGVAHLLSALVRFERGITPRAMPRAVLHAMLLRRRPLQRREEMLLSKPHSGPLFAPCHAVQRGEGARLGVGSSGARAAARTGGGGEACVGRCARRRGGGDSKGRRRRRRGRRQPEQRRQPRPSRR